MSDSTRAIVHATGLVLVLVVGTVIWKWSWIVQYRIENDLRNYGTVIRRSEISFGEKEALLNQIDGIESCLSSGGSLSYFRWRHTDAAVRDMLNCGVTGDEAKLITRELHRCHRNFE